MLQTNMDEYFETIFGYKPKKRGTGYELLVGAVLKLLNATQDVTHNVIQEGKYSKDKYQIDALVKNKFATIFIECKDYIERNKPTQRADVQKLAGALNNLDINAGILVSATGFTKPAVQYSESTKLNPNAKEIELFLIRPSTEKDTEAVKGTYLEGIIIFALNTGLRKSDILPLLWEDIRSYDDKVIHLYVRKTNKYVDMPCTKMLYEFIECTPKDKRHGAIFINPLTKQFPKDIKRAWNTAKKKAGIENLRFHDLRHTVATRLVNAGVPLPTVKKVMTHSDIATTMRYVHTPETELFKAMEVLNSCNEDLIQND